jgi:2,4-dienoyl-CoA reductase (NADPH2)
MPKQFTKLFEAGRIGCVEIKNRIVRSGAGTFAANDNYVSDIHEALYKAFAKGGAGLVIMESVFLNYDYAFYPPISLRLDDDKYIPKLKELTDIIHEHGAKTFLQVLHMGTWHFEVTGYTPLSASTMSAEELPPAEQPFPPSAPARGVSLKEIKEIINGFTEMAERSKRAGFDGYEINAAGSHFLNSFLSRIWNKRDDKYGSQTLENRVRIVTDIIKAIKQRVGADFVVGVLFNGMESGWGEKGTSPAEAIEFAKLFEAAGADYLQVRAFGYGEDAVRQWIENAFYPEKPDVLPAGLNWADGGAGAYLPLSKAVKEVVSIPVLTVGRMGPDLGERALKRGEADFIAMQRRLIADPDLPNKAAEGRTEDIRPCMACLYCASGAEIGQLECRVNPCIGHPEDFEIKQADKKKRVVVVGAGPAGMEAAQTAALRGHEVTLFEKESTLGGLMPMAATIKGTEIEDLPLLIEYYKTQLDKLGVVVKTKTEFTLSHLDALKADAVIVAVGGRDQIPDIPGIGNKKIVASGASLHKMLAKLLSVFSAETLRKLTKLYMPLGKRVIIIGGEVQGAELAEFLITRDHIVTIVDKISPMDMGKGLAGIKRFYLNSWFMRKRPTIITEVSEFKQITNKGLSIVDKDGVERLLEADSIVTALPVLPDTGLYDSLSGKVDELYAVGDCTGGGLIIDAIRQGYSVALKI